LLIADADLEAIRKMRVAIEDGAGDNLEKSAKALAAAFVSRFESVVLCRVFCVLPLAELPEAEQKAAEASAAGRAVLGPGTRVLSLMATRGREPSWNERRQSRGHRAIPLIDSTFVQGAPMIAKLLADLKVDLANLDTGSAIATRQMLGGMNMTFYVPDAAEARDALDRRIIGDADFVQRYGVKTVFGMGGAYATGQVVVAIAFSTEKLGRITVDRFPNLIGTFKIKTAALVQAGKIFAA
jgi:hypothetical protein